MRQFRNNRYTLARAIPSRRAISVPPTPSAPSTAIVAMLLEGGPGDANSRNVDSPFRVRTASHGVVLPPAPLRVQQTADRSPNG
jgi:hypothetical protein